MDISKALVIKKGAPAEDLEWLARAAVGKQRIVELGSFHGRSTRAMLDNSEAHIWCIDTWRGSRPGVSHGLVVDDDDFMVFLENIRDVRERVTVLKMSTREAVGLLPEGCFDEVFIDADHGYAAVRFDIVHYAPLLREGGLLCGHDKSWKGVARAVGELLTHSREGGSECWWTIREKGWMYEVGRDQLDDVYYMIGKLG